MNSWLFRWSICLAWSLTPMLTLSWAHAQTTLPPATATPSPSAPTLLQYHSVFTHYQPFSDQPLTPWPDSNATVAKIGGWRVYAKEARPADPAQVTDPATSPPANTDAHGEHDKKP